MNQLSNNDNLFPIILHYDDENHHPVSLTIQRIIPKDNGKLLEFEVYGYDSTNAPSSYISNKAFKWQVREHGKMPDSFTEQGHMMIRSAPGEPFHHTLKTRFMRDTIVDIEIIPCEYSVDELLR